MEQQGLKLYRFDLSDEDVGCGCVASPATVLPAAPADTVLQALFTPTGRKRLYEALAVLLDTRNHPMLVHDDTGKAAVTLVCALMRCFQRWALTAVYAEGDMFAGAGGSEGGGVGDAGREFIAMFDPHAVAVERDHAPLWVRV